MATREHSPSLGKPRQPPLHKGANARRHHVMRDVTREKRATYRRNEVELVEACEFHVLKRSAAKCIRR